MAQCLGLIDGDWKTSTATRDPVAAVRHNELSGLPGGGSASIRHATDYSTPEDYVHDNSGILHPEVRIDAMHRDGYRDGVVAEFESSRGEFDVTALGFANNDAAIDYLEVHLRDACQLVQSVARLPGGEGVVYVRTDGLAKAVFVVGDAEISICGCFHSSDPASDAATAAENIYAVLTDSST